MYKILIKPNILITSYDTFHEVLSEFDTEYKDLFISTGNETTYAKSIEYNITDEEYMLFKIECGHMVFFDTLEVEHVAI